ncbi:hypothetical protein BBEV_0401 [Salisediminibacterium beveridgei]|uniref:Uncharacterized protein n=1 Tax=Salisediminibacterium beveridgei TaxID=632773 RepID=A0A1D7QS10_9BACI|nr:hypothetical protein BBEV_0401 [Salisediminibacterium beveridgei]
MMLTQLRQKCPADGSTEVTDENDQRRSLDQVVQLMGVAVCCFKGVIELHSSSSFD